MQVLYDRPTLQGSDLVGSLAGSGEVLRTVLDPVQLHDVALVWQALAIPYMLCLSYAVKVALLRSTMGTIGSRIVTVDRRYGSRAVAAGRGA